MLEAWDTGQARVVARVCCISPLCSHALLSTKWCALQAENLAKANELLRGLKAKLAASHDAEKAPCNW